MSRLAFLMFFAFPLTLGQIVQFSPGREDFWNGLEQFAGAAEKQLADKPIPDFRYWKSQRIVTIKTLNDLRQKLDNVCFYATCGKAAGSGMGIMCALTSLAATIMGFMGFLLPLPIMGVGGFMCPSAYFTKEASSSMELVLSTKYQRELQAVLIKDKEFSYSLNEWLKSSPNLEAEVPKIFGFDLKSEISENFILLNEFSRLFGLTKNFKEAIHLMKQGKYSSSLGKSIGINDLRVFSKRISDSPHISRKIQLSLSILSVLVDATGIYRNVAGKKMPSPISFVKDKFNIKIPPAVKVTASILLNLLDLGIEITSFMEAIEIIKDGTCPYSDSLKRIIDMLNLELTFIESFSR